MYTYTQAFRGCKLKDTNNDCSTYSKNVINSYCKNYVVHLCYAFV